MKQNNQGEKSFAKVCSVGSQFVLLGDNLADG